MLIVDLVKSNKNMLVNITANEHIIGTRENDVVYNANNREGHKECPKLEY
jgi:hypothetical protein